MNELFNIREFLKLADEMASGHPSKDAIEKAYFIFTELAKVDSTIVDDGFPWRGDPFGTHSDEMRLQHRILSHSGDKIGETTCPDIAISIASIVNAFIMCEKIARDKGPRSKTRRR